MEKWKKVGMFANLDIEACGNKRRLVTAEGKIEHVYFIDSEPGEN